MASTPSSRLKQPQSNSPHGRRAKSPRRGRNAPQNRLSLKTVVGTTCTSPKGFDASQTSFAYIAGGAVVVVDVDGDQYEQRFFRARPSAVPVYSPPVMTNLSITPNATPKATPKAAPKASDSRNRSAPLRDSAFGGADWSDSPASRSWTARERIKAATCLALSREGKFLAVGETGYAPRVLIFSLDDVSSNRPLVCISEHMFGVTAVAWSADSRFLASIGAANDGFLYLWRIDPNTGTAKLHQQNRCTSQVRGMIWMGDNLITLGQRHVKLWRAEEAPTTPLKQKFGDVSFSPSCSNRTLPGRNVLLGDLLDATFSCAVTIDETHAIVCSEAGDVCLFDDTDKQAKLIKVLEVGFTTTCVVISGQRVVYVGGKSGHIATIDLGRLLACDPGSVEEVRQPVEGLAGPVAAGFLQEQLVTVDSQHSVDMWSKTGNQEQHANRCQISGHRGAILGVEVLPQPNRANAAFYTWTGSGTVFLWDLGGQIIEEFKVTLDKACSESGSDSGNQLLDVKVTSEGSYFITGDKLGVLKVIDFATMECVTEMRAHGAHCQFISTFENDTDLLVASCGRDRTAQLFHRTSRNVLQHFQTLEFAAKVVQVLIASANRVITCSLDKTIQIHELVTKEEDTDFRAAIPAVRSITVKARPASMSLTADRRHLFVSLVDRTASLYNIESGRLVTSFKCTDETGTESVVLDSLLNLAASDREPALLLATSNTDKSIRLYDARNGAFLGREWGHTEGVTGIALVEEAGGRRRVVSVGSDGTIMIWGLDLEEHARPATSRDPSPAGDVVTSARTPLRHVLSKAELAELHLQRPSTSGRGSSSRTLATRRSHNHLSTLGRTPCRSTPSSTLAGTPSLGRNSSQSSSPGSPQSPSGLDSPNSPSFRSSVKSPRAQQCTSELRAVGSLNLATQQACRDLKAYREKLTSSEPISPDALAELDQELRLTSLALGDRAKQSRSIGDSVLNDVLDQYSSRLMAMLEQRLPPGSLSPGREEPREPEAPESPQNRPGSSATSSTVDSA